MTEMKINMENVRSVYFIGIGGIGMSALARHFHERGINTGGYDKTSSSLTRQLEAEGISIHYKENISLIPKEADFVVYTPAIPADHAELVYYRQHGYKVIKRSDALQAITESSFNICVAGTHGKTTISTMIAHLLRDSGYGCNAFLGGISVNYDTNYWSSKKNVMVVEADEYDRSFLKLNPDIAVISAMDPDHLDIYGTAEEMEKAFIEFGSKIRTGGLLVIRQGLKREKAFRAAEKFTYSLRDNRADVYAENIRSINGSYTFDVVIKEKKIENLSLHVGGLHNVENMVAAMAAISSLEIDTGKIWQAVESFRGVKRRFEYVISPAASSEKGSPVFIDDYAHHPEELRALITGVRDLFSGRKCIVVFQPHLYSRTRDLADGFAEVLDTADEVILLPIYPAREKPVEGVNSEMIIDRMKNKNKKMMDKETFLEWVRTGSGSLEKTGSTVLVTAGAGDIDLLVQPVKEILTKN